MSQRAQRLLTEAETKVRNIFDSFVDLDLTTDEESRARELANTYMADLGPGAAAAESALRAAVKSVVRERQS